MVQTARSPPDWRLAVSSCSASSSLNFTRMWMAYLSKALQPSKSGQPQYRETWPLHPMLRSMRRKCSSMMPTMRLTSGSQLSCMAYQGTSGATLQLFMLPGLSVCCIGESLLSSMSLRQSIQLTFFSSTAVVSVCRSVLAVVNSSRRSLMRSVRSLYSCTQAK